MKLILQKFLFIIPLLFFPVYFVHAGPEAVWDNTPTVSNGTLTGYINVTGVEAQMPPLMLIVFSDSDQDFSPYISYAVVGPAVNGQVSFQTPNDGVLTYFLPVIIDEASFAGGFSPYQAGGQFQIYSVGQVASTGGGTNPNPNNPPDPNNPNPSDPNNPVPVDDSQSLAINGWPVEVIDNPLQVSDLNNFVVGLLNALIKIGIPVMVVFLVYSGLRLVMARGNEKELEDAKKNLLWVIIGAAILLGGWTIVKVLKGTFDEIDLAYINSLINYFV